MLTPRYYFAMFGDPVPPDKDLVESGIYHPNPRHAPFPTEQGDLLLLYCTENYHEHPMQIPGIGIVLNTTNEAIRYRYLPLAKSIPKDSIERFFVAADLAKFKNRRFDTFWLFEIARTSFVSTIGASEIAWP